MSEQAGLQNQIATQIVNRAVKELAKVNFIEAAVPNGIMIAIAIAAIVRGHSTHHQIMWGIAGVIGGIIGGVIATGFVATDAVTQENFLHRRVSRIERQAINDINENILNDSIKVKGPISEVELGLVSHRGEGSDIALIRDILGTEEVKDSPWTFYDKKSSSKYTCPKLEKMIGRKAMTEFAKLSLNLNPSDPLLKLSPKRLALPRKFPEYRRPGVLYGYRSDYS